jgi:2-hydroxy-6-oxonona-2,4-dienedioate hydrolase
MTRLLVVCIVFGSAYGMLAQEPIQKDVSVLGFKLHYRELGRGRTVVLLHGLGADGTRWERNIGPLSRHFRVIAVDQIGFGQSDKPMANYHNGMLSEFLVRFLAALGVAKASLVGNSMGAQVALHVAVHHPEVVERLVLVDGGNVRPAGAPAPPPMPPERQRIMNGVTSQDMRELLELLVYDKSLITDRMIDDTLMAHLRSAYAIGKILEAGPKLNSLTEEEVRTVKLPSLIIWGKNDVLTGPAAADRLAEIIPSARRVIIAEAGHMPHWERPDDFNRVVIDFLRHDLANPQAGSRHQRF